MPPVYAPSLFADPNAAGNSDISIMLGTWSPNNVALLHAETDGYPIVELQDSDAASLGQCTLTENVPAAGSKRLVTLDWKVDASSTTTGAFGLLRAAGGIYVVLDLASGTALVDPGHAAELRVLSNVVKDGWAQTLVEFSPVTSVGAWCISPAYSATGTTVADAAAVGNLTLRAYDLNFDFGPKEVFNICFDDAGVRTLTGADALYAGNVANLSPASPVAATDVAVFSNSATAPIDGVAHWIVPAKGIASIAVAVAQAGAGGAPEIRIDILNGNEVADSVLHVPVGDPANPDVVSFAGIAITDNTLTVRIVDTSTGNMSAHDIWVSSVTIVGAYPFMQFTDGTLTEFMDPHTPFTPTGNVSHQSWIRPDPANAELVSTPLTYFYAEMGNASFDGSVSDNDTLEFDKASPVYNPEGFYYLTSNSALTYKTVATGGQASGNLSRALVVPATITEPRNIRLRLVSTFEAETSAPETFGVELYKNGQPVSYAVSTNPANTGSTTIEVQYWGPIIAGDEFSAKAANIEGNDDQVGENYFIVIEPLFTEAPVLDSERVSAEVCFDRGQLRTLAPSEATLSNSAEFIPDFIQFNGASTPLDGVAEWLVEGRGVIDVTFNIARTNLSAGATAQPAVLLEIIDTDRDHVVYSSVEIPTAEFPTTGAVNVGPVEIFGSGFIVRVTDASSGDMTFDNIIVGEVLVTGAYPFLKFTDGTLTELANPTTTYLPVGPVTHQHPVYPTRRPLDESIMGTDLTMAGNRTQDFANFSQTWQNVGNLSLAGDFSIGFSTLSFSAKMGIGQIEFTYNNGNPNGIVGGFQSNGNFVRLFGSQGGATDVEFAIDNSGNPATLGEAQTHIKTRDVTRGLAATGAPLQLVNASTGETEYRPTIQQIFAQVVAGNLVNPGEIDLGDGTFGVIHEGTWSSGTAIASNVVGIVEVGGFWYFGTNRRMFPQGSRYAQVDSGDNLDLVGSSTNAGSRVWVRYLK